MIVKLLSIHVEVSVESIDWIGGPGSQHIINLKHPVAVQPDVTCKLWANFVSQDDEPLLSHGSIA